MDFADGVAVSGGVDCNICCVFPIGATTGLRPPKRRRAWLCLAQERAQHREGQDCEQGTRKKMEEFHLPSERENTEGVLLQSIFIGGVVGIYRSPTGCRAGRVEELLCELRSFLGTC